MEYISAGATVSNDGQYRYKLWRQWDASKGGVVFCMLNPSTADGQKDDPTIRKCVGFASRLGAGAISVVNLFAYRATDPKNLLLAYHAGRDVVGPENNAALDTYAAAASLSAKPPARGRGVLFYYAYGALHKDLQWRVDEVQQVVSARLPVRDQKMLAQTKAGHPRHPLMLAYSTLDTTPDTR